MTLINGDECISDESDFIGNRAEKRKWNARQSPVTILEREWKVQKKIHPQAVIDLTSEDVLSAPKKSPESITSEVSGPYAPYDSIQSGKHSDESVDDFLRRVPPINCPLSVPWLWVANPHYKSENKTNSGDSEDEDEDQIWSARCRSILDEYERKAAIINEEMTGKAKASITRKLNPLRKDIPEQIQAIAKEAGIVCGKWMLFPTEDLVTSTWSTVCRAVVAGQLGHTAKVAAHPSSGSARLICVYTQDFSDIKDVKRVLYKLDDLGLVPNNNLGIHYKCDAYTYLGIESKNEYGLKASIYSSNKLLAEGD